MTRMIATTLVAGCALATLASLPAKALQLEQPTEFFQAVNDKASKWGRMNGTPPAEGFVYQPPNGGMGYGPFAILALPAMVVSPVFGGYGYGYSYEPQPRYASTTNRRLLRYETRETYAPGGYDAQPTGRDLVVPGRRVYR